MCIVRIAEQVDPPVVLRMILVVDEQAVNRDLAGHRARVAEIVHPVVPHADQMRPGRFSAGGHPATVADDEVALPGAAIVAAETDQVSAIQGGILDGQQAAADGVEPHVAQGTAPDRIAARDTHMGVHSGEGAVFEQDVLAKV